MLKGIVCVCGLVAGAACTQAQEPGSRMWEVGVIGGFAYSPTLDVNGPPGSASTGFKNSPAAGVFGGNDTYEHWSGEASYLYRFGDLNLSSGGASVDFGARTHNISADILFHFRPRRATVRPFVAFGGGIRVFEGTGTESAAQPLGRLAALTHTREIAGMGDAGLGVKVNLRKSVRLRFEIRDFIGERPRKVIAAAPGAKVSGLLHDIQGLVGLSYAW